MRGFVLAAALAGLAGTAHAQIVGSVGDIPPAAPRLQTVVAADKLHFIKDGGGCPNATPACAERSFLLPGDSVVVMEVKGDYADAVFTGGAPHYRSTRGWLPRSALAAAPATVDAAAWVGAWHSGDQQSIDIQPAAGGRLQLTGDATWGADDSDRVARGGVNVGEFSTSLAPKGAMVTFSPGGDDAPATLDPPLTADDCVLRLWLLGPYLLAADNGRCGGNNVTFDGLYRRGPAKR